MRSKLTIPAQVVFSVIAVSCASSPTTHGDATTDSVDALDAVDALDGALADALDVPELADVVASDRSCTRDPFNPEGRDKVVRCLPRRGATMPCPEATVCVAGDCPAHCEGCVSPLFCIPDSERDAGVACVVSTVCSEDACNPGCRAVG